MTDFTNVITLTPDEFAEKFAPTMRTQLLRFLADREAHEDTFRVERKTLHILKSRFDDETDFLYVIHSYANEAFQPLDGKLEYGGMYSHTLGKLIDAGYYLRDVADQGTDRETLLNRFYDAADERIAAIIGGKPVPVDESQDASVFEQRDRDYFEKYDAQSEAVNCYLEDRSPMCSHRPRREMLRADKFVRAINHMDDAARDYAAEYVKEHAREINLRIWKAELVEKHLAQIKAAPGEYLTRKRIAASIPDDCKTVNVVMNRDGKTLSLKVEARAIRGNRNEYYSTYYMDAASRSEFEKAFGRSENLKPADIIRITYAKRVLYEA